LLDFSEDAVIGIHIEGNGRKSVSWEYFNIDEKDPVSVEDGISLLKSVLQCLEYTKRVLSQDLFDEYVVAQRALRKNLE
jgi:hypothetical protein